MDASCVLVDSLSQSRLIIEPNFGCVATSWTVAGDERLALPSARDAFLASSRTGGIPLLYPYANRLRSDTCEVAGKHLDFAVIASLKRDPGGLPIHGLLLRWPAWKLSRRGENHLEASLRWHDHAELMRAYSFAHTLRISWTLSGDAATAVLAVTTSIEADGGVDVPIAFGWHPYFAVDLASATSLALPRRTSIALDAQGLPQRHADARGAAACAGLASDARGSLAASSESAGENQDSLYALDAQANAGAPPAAAALPGAVPDALLRTPPAPGESHRASVTNDRITTEIDFSREYRFMQVFSPRGAPFVCIEPMSAATAALSDGCEMVTAGETFAATFTLRSSAHARLLA